MKILASIIVGLIFLASAPLAHAQSTVPQGGTGTTTVPAGWFLKGNTALRLTATRFISLVSDITGTLGVSNGGTGSTTLSGLLKGNGTSAIQTAIAGTDYFLPSAFGATFYTFFHATTTDALSQGSTNLYWSNTLFDNRLSATTSLPNITTLANLGTVKTSLTGILKATSGVLSTAVAGTDYEVPLTFTYPLQRSTNTISLAFGTTTANSWSALQQFNAGATTTRLTISSGDLWLTGKSDGCAYFQSGMLLSTGVACGSGSGGITSLNGLTGASQTFATGTATGIGLSITSSGTTHTFTPTVSSGYSIPLTASTSDWNTAYINRITSASAPLSISSNAISISQAGSGSNGYLSSTDWNTFNGKQAALTFTYPLVNTTNTISLAFGTTTTNAWSNIQTFNGGATIANTLTLSGITGSTQCLHVNSSGQVSGTGADCGSGSSSFGQSWEINGSGSLAPTTTIPVFIPDYLRFDSGSTYIKYNNPGLSINTPDSVQITTGAAPSLTVDTTNGVYIPNNIGYSQYTTGGSILPILNLDSSDIVQVGNASQALVLNGISLTTPITGGTLFADGSGVVSAQSGTSGNCVQWGSNGSLDDAGAACGTGGTYTAGAGLTLTTGTFSVNTTQNISRLSNLTLNAIIKTDLSDGTLSYAIAGTDYQVPLVLTTTGTSGAATFDGTTLNIPQYANTTYTSSYPITLSGTNFSLAFGTTTANSWSALQSFANSSTTLASVSNTLWITPLGTAAGAFLAVDPNGKVIATTSPSGGGGSGTVNSGTTGQLPYYAANGTALTATSSIFLAANGNVGIGSTSPYALLGINAPAGTAPYLAIGSTTAGDVFKIAPSASTLVGIGTTSPYAMLSIGGGDLVLGGATAGGTPGDLYLPKLGTSAGAFLAVDAAGKVIATTTPSGGGGSYTATYPITLTGSAFGIAFGTTTTNTWSNLQTFSSGIKVPALTGVDFTAGVLGFTAGGSFQLTDIGGGNYLSIDSSHRIVLQASLNGNNNSILNIGSIDGGSSANSGITLKSTSGTGTTDFIKFAVGTNGATEALRAISNGNIGLGTTSPYAKLAVAGDVVLGASSAGGTPGDLYLPKLGTAAGAFLAVDASGKVIATTTPAGGGGTNYFTNSGASTYLSTGSKLGVGSSTPWGILSVAAASISDYSIPLLSISTSSDAYGVGFNVFATTSNQTPTNPTLFSDIISGIRVAIGSISQYGFGGVLDQLFVNGRINTGEWQLSECKSGMIVPGSTITSSANNICGAFTFQVVSSGLMGTSGGGLRLAENAGTTGSANLTGPSVINVGSTTPVLEATVSGYTQTGGGTGTSTKFVGFGSSTTGNQSVGCFFVASSTQANWIALCDNGGAGDLEVDTGIASSTVSFTRFRIEMDKAGTNFYTQSAGGNMTFLTRMTTNQPGISLYPVLLNYVSTGGLASGLDFQYVRIWARNSLYR